MLQRQREQRKTTTAAHSEGDKYSRATVFSEHTADVANLLSCEAQLFRVTPNNELLHLLREHCVPFTRRQGDLVCLDVQGIGPPNRMLFRIELLQHDIYYADVVPQRPCMRLCAYKPLVSPN